MAGSRTPFVNAIRASGPRMMTTRQQKQRRDHPHKFACSPQHDCPHEARGTGHRARALPCRTDAQLGSECGHYQPVLREVFQEAFRFLLLRFGSARAINGSDELSNILRLAARGDGDTLDDMDTAFCDSSRPIIRATRTPIPVNKAVFSELIADVRDVGFFHLANEGGRGARMRDAGAVTPPLSWFR